MIARHITYTFILTCCRLTLIYCPYFIAKCIVLSNISVVSDNILRICIQESLLILKKNIVLLHTLSAYNSLLVRYKVYSSDPRECLCTS